MLGTLQREMLQLDAVRDVLSRGVDSIVLRRGMKRSDLCLKYATLEAIWRVDDGGNPVARPEKSLIGGW